MAVGPGSFGPNQPPHFLFTVRTRRHPIPSSSDILRVVAEAPEQRLYVPSMGYVDFRLRRAIKAVEEYDPKLILAKHELTGDWVVFVPLGPDRMYPAVGLGQELPEPDEIRRILERADTRRHGDKILRQIQEHNDRIMRAKRAAADEAIEEAADYADFGFRKYAGIKPHIFIP